MHKLSTVFPQPAASWADHQVFQPSGQGPTKRVLSGFMRLLRWFFVLFELSLTPAKIREMIDSRLGRDSMRLV